MESEIILRMLLNMGTTQHTTGTVEGLRVVYSFQYTICSNLDLGRHQARNRKHTGRENEVGVRRHVWRHVHAVGFYQGVPE